MDEVVNLEYKVLKSSRIVTSKQSYVTRNIPIGTFRYLVKGNIIPQAGQLVLARVDKIGYHSKLELPSGRRATLFVGDEIIVSYGNRYAPDQFLAEVPSSLDECQLVASGGIAASVISKHNKIKNATKITPLGLIADSEKKILSIDNYTLPILPETSKSKLVLAVTGSSMNAGKTTTAANLIKGLTKAGLKVAAAKVTGTGSGLDSWKMIDAGAYPVIDFTDLGFASTYKLTQEQLNFVLLGTINSLSSYDIDIIILEIADSILQNETSILLESENFSKYIDALFFSAGEALSVHSAVQWLVKRKLPLIAISGLLTASAVTIKETMQLCSIPVLTSKDLSNKNIYKWILNKLPKDKTIKE